MGPSGVDGETWRVCDGKTQIGKGDETGRPKDRFLKVTVIEGLVGGWRGGWVGDTLGRRETTKKWQKGSERWEEKQWNC